MGDDHLDSTSKLPSSPMNGTELHGQWFLPASEFPRESPGLGSFHLPTRPWSSLRAPFETTVAGCFCQRPPRPIDPLCINSTCWLLFDALSRHHGMKLNKGGRMLHRRCLFFTLHQRENSEHLTGSRAARRPNLPDINSHEFRRHGRPERPRCVVRRRLRYGQTETSVAGQL